MTESQRGMLACVGLGMTLGSHLTPLARSHIASADVVFVGVSDGVQERLAFRRGPHGAAHGGADSHVAEGAVGQGAVQFGKHTASDAAGQGGSFPTWIHAARALQELHGGVHPDFALEDWLAMAKRVMALGANGRVVYDYDMGIAQPFHTDAAPAAADLWPAFEALKGRPLALLRGETSAIISRETAAEMKRRVPELAVVTIPRTGHAPTLAEPESLAAIDALLAQIA